MVQYFYMLTQKLYRSGNSIAVTIPKEYLEDLGLKEGGLVEVKKRGGQLVVTPKAKITAPGVDQKFAEMVEEFMDEHADALKELSQK